MKYCISLLELSPPLLTYFPKSGIWAPLDEPLNGLWYDVQGAEPSAAGRAAVVLRAAVARTALAFVAERRHTRDAFVRDAIVSSVV